MSVRFQLKGDRNDLHNSDCELDFYDGQLWVDTRGEHGAWILSPKEAISLASKLLQYGTQAYRYPKKDSDANGA